MILKKVKVYKGFERFWHWSQALLIMFLALTGFEIHGSISLFGFEKAVHFHNNAAIALFALVVFAVFWHFTTGEWKQYIPTTKNLIDQVMFYSVGIFKGAHHPVRKTELNKLNPLQRLTYIGFKVFLIPLVVITGIFYMFHITVLENGEKFVAPFSLELVAILHTAGAILLIAFLIAHVYMTTTGHTPLANIRAMLTGYEELEVDLVDEIQDRRFSKSVDTSEAGYYSIDVNGYFIEVNKTWLDLYKYDSKDEIIGKHYSLSRKPENLEKLQIAVDTILSGGKVDSSIVRRNCKDGSVGFHSLTYNAIYEGDKIVGMEGFIIDLPPREDETRREDS